MGRLLLGLRAFSPFSWLRLHLVFRAATLALHLPCPSGCAMLSFLFGPMLGSTLLPCSRARLGGSTAFSWCRWLCRGPACSLGSHVPLLRRGRSVWLCRRGAAWCCRGRLRLVPWHAILCNGLAGNPCQSRCRDCRQKHSSHELLHVVATSPAAKRGGKLMVPSVCSNVPSDMRDLLPLAGAWRSADL